MNTTKRVSTKVGTFQETKMFEFTNLTQVNLLDPIKGVEF